MRQLPRSSRARRLFAGSDDGSGELFTLDDDAVFNRSHDDDGDIINPYPVTLGKATQPPLSGNCVNRAIAQSVTSRPKRNSLFFKLQLIPA